MGTKPLSKDAPYSCWMNEEQCNDFRTDHGLELVKFKPEYVDGVCIGDRKAGGIPLSEVVLNG